MNNGWTYTNRVNKSDAGKTVLQYYVAKYRHSTATQWQQRIEAEQILLDGKPTEIATKLKSGQKLTYNRPPWQEPKVPLSFKIIYEDADLLIIDKPSGLPVLPGGGFLEHTLLLQLQKQYPQDTPVPIHRLGRGTSGLMLLARSPKAKSHLSQQMRNQQITKVYFAKASGIIAKDELIIRDRIGKIPHPILGYIYGATPTGKYARSDCKIIERDRDSTLAEVTILTGRPHQIRIHLAAAGHPLVGDPLYSIGGIPKIDLDKVVTPGDCGYFLQASRLSFQHPITKQELSFVASIPNWN